MTLALKDCFTFNSQTENSEKDDIIRSIFNDEALSSIETSILNFGKLIKRSPVKGTYLEEFIDNAINPTGSEWRPSNKIGSDIIHVKTGTKISVKSNFMNKRGIMKTNICRTTSHDTIEDKLSHIQKQNDESDILVILTRTADKIPFGHQLIVIDTKRINYGKPSDWTWAAPTKEGSFGKSKGATNQWINNKLGHPGAKASIIQNMSGQLWLDIPKTWASDWWDIPRILT